MAPPADGAGLRQRRPGDVAGGDSAGEGDYARLGDALPERIQIEHADSDSLYARAQLLADASPVTGGDRRTRDVAVLVVQCGCESPQDSPCTARIQ